MGIIVSKPGTQRENNFPTTRLANMQVIHSMIVMEVLRGNDIAL
jgi:hypothetical protein